MDDREFLTRRFEEHRPRLRGVAYRMLGSLSEADDALQEAWLRLDRADTDDVENLPAWLTTVVARVCLNMLRSRDIRREEPFEYQDLEPASPRTSDPEQEAVLADSVGLALLVVLDLLTPAERMAFVLHDMFGVSFDEIGSIIDRTPAAARQLASRARRRVKGVERPGTDPNRQRRVVDAYLAATRSGDFEALVALLDPDVVLRADADAVPTGKAVEIRGALAVVRGALASSVRAQHTQVALVNGTVGLVMAPAGRLTVVLAFTFDDDAITGIDVIADRERLDDLDIGVLAD